MKIIKNIFNVASTLQVLRVVIFVSVLLNLPRLISSPIVLIASEIDYASLESFAFHVSLNSHRTSFSQGIHMLTISIKSTTKTLHGQLMR